MRTLQPIVTRSLWVGLCATTLLVTGCAMKKVTQLTGGQEVPPVSTTATATTDISGRHTKCYLASGTTCPTLTGTVWTAGIPATAVHVHQGAPGQNGPPIVTLVKTADGVWSIPQETNITDDQFAAWWNGNLYVNVHTDGNKAGEVRAQLKP